MVKNQSGLELQRVDRGQINKDKILQATFPVINWNENFGSAAVFLNALKVAGVEVDTSKSELVAKISDEFLTSCIEAFLDHLSLKQKVKHTKCSSCFNFSFITNRFWTYS